MLTPEQEEDLEKEFQIQREYQLSEGIQDPDIKELEEDLIQFLDAYGLWDPEDPKVREWVKDRAQKEFERLTTGKEK